MTFGAGRSADRDQSLRQVHPGPRGTEAVLERLSVVDLHFDGFDLQYIVALSAETGETLWRRDRDIDYGTDNGDVMKAFSTPKLIEVDGQLQLISATSRETYGGYARPPKAGCRPVVRLRVVVDRCKHTPCRSR